MSIATMVLGESGTGKTASLRNINPADTLLIQTVRKPLPFKSTHWEPVTKENPQGTIFVCDQSRVIVEALQRTNKSIVIIDDFQYLLLNEFMRRSDEKGYDKFTEIGRHAWDVLMKANELADYKRVYILSHTHSDDQGKVRAKTVGKMLDDKITVEGLVAIVMRTSVINGEFVFRTVNNGMDTTKCPMGLFETETIENDLAKVDEAIINFYNLKQTA